MNYSATRTSYQCFKLVQKHITVPLFVLFIFYFSCSLFAQGPPDSNRYFSPLMYEAEANFFDIVEETDRYYNDNPSEQADPTADFKRYERWKHFWTDRVFDHDSTSSTGSFDYALERLADLLNNPECQSDNPFSSDWNPLGPFSMTNQNMGIIISVVQHPNNPDIVYAGTNGSGLFKTINATNNIPKWTAMTDLPGLGVQDIVIDHSNSQVIYLATGINTYSRCYGIGVIKSINGGSTWNTTGLTISPTQDKVTYKLAMHPTNSSILYALVKDEIYKSTNGGTTFGSTPVFEVSTANDFRHLRDIKFKPGDPNTIYVSTGDQKLIYGGAQVFRTTDGFTNNSQNLTEITPNMNPVPNNSIRIGLAVRDGESNSLWIILRDGSKVEIQKSTDSGDNFLNPPIFASTPGGLSTALAGIGWWYAQLIISPADADILYANGWVAAKSIDEGISFNRITRYNGAYGSGDYTHADQRLLYLESSTIGGASDKLYAGDDGGVSFTDNGGNNSWNNINGIDLDITQFNGICLSERNQNISGGAQDNGLYTLSGGVWTVDIGGIGDGYQCATDPNDPLIVYGQGLSTSSNLHKSVDGGQSWPSISQPSGDRRSNRPMVIHSNSDLYIGHHDVFVSTDGGSSWTQKSNFTADHGKPGFHKLGAIAVAPSNDKYIYAAYEVPNWIAPYYAGKIFMTDEGDLANPTWTDITAGLWPMRYNGITDIIVDPDDPERIWITFNMWYDPVWHLGNDDGLSPNRVYHSPDGGTTWENWSKNLPNYPVNSIVYQKGTNDGLYAANDVGVYFYDATAQQWECFSEGLPSAIYSDLEIRYCSNSIIASTYGRGVWESPLATVAVDVQDITSNTTWPNTVDLKSDLNVKAGATLTITGTVNVPLNRKITVERGAKIILDGGTLTNMCGQLWKGVEVWGRHDLGHPNIPIVKSGAYPSQSDDHGVIWIKNGGTIENARDGITVGRPSGLGFNLQYSGGIVIAENSNFINNRRAIEYVEFKQKNRGYFRDCTFETNSTLNDPSVLPVAFVTMWAVDRVGFYGNTFKNTTSEPYSDKGIGIYSVDASYIVKPSGIITLIPNTFQGLNYGIWGTSGAGIGMIYIAGNNFYDNNKGVELGGTTYARIIDNNFEIPTGTGLRPIGVSVLNSYFFTVEGNTFSENGNPSGKNWGVIIRDDPNYNGGNVYNNTFSNTFYGIQSEVTTGNDNDLNYANIDCNSFSAHQYDIPIPSGRLSDQGTCILAQENTFNPTPPFATSHIHHHTNLLPPKIRLTYIAENGFKPVNYTTPEVYTYQVSDCKFQSQNIPNNCDRIIPGDIGTLKDDINAMNEDLENFMTHIDGNDKDFLLYEINENEVISDIDLKIILIEYSPLSDEVLINAIHRESPLNDSYLKEVIIENSKVTDPVYVALENRTQVLPDSIMDQIDSAQSNTSPRDSLDVEINQIKFERQLELDELVRLYIDTNFIDSAVLYLDAENTIGAYYAKIQLLTSSDTASAFQEINELRSMADSIKAITPYDSIYNHVYEFCSFHELAIELQNDSNGYYGMDSLQMITLATLASTTYFNYLNAQNIIHLVFDEYDPWVPQEIVPDQAKRTLPLEEEVKNHIDKSDWLSIYPNPFNKSTTIEYRLPDNAKSANIVVYEVVTGRKVRSFSIDKADGQVVMLANELSTGLYICNLVVDNIIIETKKLTLSE